MIIFSKHNIKRIDVNAYNQLEELQEIIFSIFFVESEDIDVRFRTNISNLSISSDHRHRVIQVCSECFLEFLEKEVLITEERLSPLEDHIQDELIEAKRRNFEY